MPSGNPAQDDPEAGSGGPEPGARQFYLRTMEALNAAGLAWLVGGGYALGHYTGVERHTRDFDIFVRREDYDAIMRVLTGAGYTTELTFPHWLGKARCEHGYVDVIFSSGNGVTTVDDAWFRHAAAGEVFGVPVKLCPVEEMIWSKAYIMERERYDCADIMHLLLACADKLDWLRLLNRFAAHWRVLFAHLCLFGFVYPGERARIPAWVMSGCIGRLNREIRAAPRARRLCQGTLLSREQYLIDIQRWGFADVRHTEASTMTPDDIVLWTEAIDETK
ncbi:MAG: nucleotidyltransferase domain-containing protein [Steroidobacteraceae bacterium]